MNPRRPPTLGERFTIGQLRHYLEWQHMFRAMPERQPVKQALWHCLVMNGAASGVTFPSPRLDWVLVERPEVDGETKGAQHVWHQVRAMMFHECLTRIAEDGRECERHRLRHILDTDGSATPSDVADEKIAEAASAAVTAYMTQCPESKFTKGIKPW